MTQNLENLRHHLPDELTPDPRERGKYVCPLCGSGSEQGSGHDGAFSIMEDGIHGKCFACDFYGDIFDLEAAKTGLPLPEATRAVVARYEFASASPAAPAADPAAAAPAASFAGMLAACHSSLQGSAGEKYLHDRGINSTSIDRFNLGLVNKDRWGHPAITMPHDKKGSYYTTRSIIDGVEHPHDRPSGVKTILYNEAALWQDEPCFVVESQLCAISIMQEGGSAIALCGVAGINLLLTTIDARKPSAMLILSMDNDDPGQKAQEKLAAALAERNIPYLEFNVAGDCKDPNELLQRDPAALHGSVAAAVEIAKAAKAAEAERERAEYEAQTTAANFASFESFLSENGDRPPVPTGFNSLDRVLNGGLTAGLYIMGAISSLGKTSWMLNIADNIASAGRDVLYFSLEMSRNELIAKSISRLSFMDVSKHQGNVDDAFTTFGVMNSRGRSSLSFTQNAVLDRSFRAYREGPGQHLWIFEGVGNFGVAEITQKVEDHIRITGRSPVVFIDYLQILAPEDPRSTDKQNTDKAVVELKRLSASHDLPIFCISSLNRANYSESITMAAFKESGAIEYGSDVLIGIQLYGVGYRPGEKQTAHATRVRELVEKAEKDPQVDIEVKVLKNRNGARGGSGRLLFDKKYNFFSEIPGDFTYTDISTPFDEDEKEEEGFLL